MSIIGLVALAQIAQAEPGQSAKFLMNEPTSLLDFGIYKLENHIRSYKDTLRIKHQPPDSVFVDYNWDKNRIIIGLSYGEAGKPRIEEIKNEIQAAINALKGRYGVGADGKLLHKGLYSGISEYFSHKGYQSKGRPEGLEKEIDQMVELKVVYHIQNYSRYFECSSMFLGDELICSGYLP